MGKAKKYLSIGLVIIIIVCAFGYYYTKDDKESETTAKKIETVETIEEKNNKIDSNSELEEKDLEVQGINDSFVQLDLKEIQVNGIEPNDINLEDIVVHNVDIKEINSIEIEVVSINDEFVYLAYQNFVSVYGDDFDLNKFFLDVGIGATAVLVWVTLSFAGESVGTYLGAVFTSELAPKGLVVGAAIDAGVSAYEAYQEGGDSSYIVGHTLNGVADGFKWAAIIAPITRAGAGVKAIKAVSKLNKIPGFEKVSGQEAKKIFEQFPEIIKLAGKNADNISDDMAKEIASKMSKEVSEDVVKKLLGNHSVIKSIIKQYNPYGVKGALEKSLREQFLENAGMTNEVAEKFVKNLKNKTIKSFDDIQKTVGSNASEYIKKNMYEFVEYFGNCMSKDFINDNLKRIAGDDAYRVIKDYITSDNFYLELIEKVGKENADNLLNDKKCLILMQLRYGTKYYTKAQNVKLLYDQIIKNNKLDESKIKKVVQDLLNGSYKSLDDIKKINSQIANNICESKELTAKLISDLGKSKQMSSLIDDISIESFNKLDIAVGENTCRDIIKNSLSKAEIIEKYGDNVYEKLLNNNEVIGCLGIQTDINKSLIQSVTEDSLKANNISEDIITKIMSGESTKLWGLSDKDIGSISNIVSNYYATTNKNTYSNFVKEVAEIRYRNIKLFLETKYKKKITNIEFAGKVMEPSGVDADLIKAKYGDIYMSKGGFAIFDDYAIAKVEIKDLVGLDQDIKQANILHHGTTKSIPGYTWHHLEDGKTLILIPTDLHNAYKHTGGASLLRDGLKVIS